MNNFEQSVIERDDSAPGLMTAWGAERLVSLSGKHVAIDADAEQVAERAARASLRTQIARLEQQRSAIVGDHFPHICAPVVIPAGAGYGPALLDLGELERSRDRLAAAVQELRARVVERVEHERQAHEQLQRMRLEPGRYKFARLPVRDLGQGVCGVWEVRPRLGLIGMLAGWWELKLSSGCPLPRGSRSTRGPGSRR
ncbi:MAG TPA: hypothetical protein VK680_04745 [Solirubrobacteraceae bacterium]|nr:hypothetical protein [Solirubrobacteraceae bacterium]